MVFYPSSVYAKVMKSAFLESHKIVRDVLGVIFFIIAVIVGAWLINLFLFRSFSVSGQSMEPTLYTGDRLIVNRVPVTLANVQGKQYQPERGQIIVFKNPQYSNNLPDEYIVKRVIGLPGERVVLKNGSYTVYNAAHPNGFNPDELTEVDDTPHTAGEADVVVKPGELFVSGDHREEGYSFDSRNGLGEIPFYDVIGPVSVRLFPFTQIRSF